ncbi:hypothetical protein ACI65C_000689 [Semiaphis heraclei]
MVLRCGYFYYVVMINTLLIQEYLILYLYVFCLDQKMNLHSAFLVCNSFGAFPIVYDTNNRSFSISKFGLLFTFVYVVIVGLQIHTHLTLLFFGAIKKTSAVTSIVLSINGIGLLCILLRRMAFVKDTVRCYNSLSEWPVEMSVRKSSTLILYASTVAVLMEFIGDNIDRHSKNKPMNLDNITTYAFLGLEMQFIHTFHVIGRLYSDLNNYVESGLINDLERIRQARKRNLVLYTFCKKFNLHYNMDLIILLSCYQLYVLLVLFKLMNNAAMSIATENFIYNFVNLKVIIRIIRMTRLFVVFIYFIESSSYLHNKSVFTFYHILRNRVNCLKHQTKEQVYLFLNELNATEVDISANDCYDVNKNESNAYHCMYLVLLSGSSYWLYLFYVIDFKVGVTCKLLIKSKFLVWYLLMHNIQTQIYFSKKNDSMNLTLTKKWVFFIDFFILLNTIFLSNVNNEYLMTVVELRGGDYLLTL